MKLSKQTKSREVTDFKQMHEKNTCLQPSASVNAQVKSCRKRISIVAFEYYRNYIETLTKQSFPGQTLL